MPELNKNDTTAIQLAEFDNRMNMELSLIIHHDEIALLAEIISKIVHEKIGSGQWRKI